MSSFLELKPTNLRLVGIEVLYMLVDADQYYGCYSYSSCTLQQKVPHLKCLIVKSIALYQIIFLKPSPYQAGKCMLFESEYAS